MCDRSIANIMGSARDDGGRDEDGQTTPSGVCGLTPLGACPPEVLPRATWPSRLVCGAPRYLLAQPVRPATCARAGASVDPRRRQAQVESSGPGSQRHARRTGSRRYADEGHPASMMRPEARNSAASSACDRLCEGVFWREDLGGPGAFATGGRMIGRRVLYSRRSREPTHGLSSRRPAIRPGPPCAASRGRGAALPPTWRSSRRCRAFGPAEPRRRFPPLPRSSLLRG